MANIESFEKDSFSEDDFEQVPPDDIVASRRG